MYRALFTLLGIIVLGGYGYAAFTGREFRTRKPTFTPAAMRGAHVGRSFWYYGYHGGK